MDLTSYLLGKNASSGGGGGGTFNATIKEVNSTVDYDYGIKQFISEVKNIKISVSYAGRLFQNDTALETVTSIDCNNSCGSLFHVFDGCSNLETIEEITNTGALTDIGYICYNCTKLKDFPSFDSSHIEGMGYAFANCTLLSDETLNNILDICIHATSYTSTKKLSALGITDTTLKNKIPTLSNYQDFLNAGWTIA